MGVEIVGALCWMCEMVALFHLRPFNEIYNYLLFLHVILLFEKRGVLMGIAMFSLRGPHLCVNAFLTLSQAAKKYEKENKIHIFEMKCFYLEHLKIILVSSENEG